jgi:phosphoglucomutase
MDGLYREYGYYRHRLISIDYEGAAGMQRMKEIISNLGENPPQTIGGRKVLSISDYRSSTRLDIATGETTPIHLPKSSVLSYALPEDAQVVVRPSGTEPKMKIYLTARQDTPEASEGQLDILDKDIRSLLK